MMVMIREVLLKGCRFQSAEGLKKAMVVALTGIAKKKVCVVFCQWCAVKPVMIIGKLTWAKGHTLFHSTIYK
jgi:hypothetical protein